MKFLALLPVLFLMLLAGCNNNTEEDSMLAAPPYKMVTDSIHQAPKNAALYYRRGSLLYQNNEKQYAENDLRKAWTLQPTEEHALSMVTILKEKNTDSAISFIERALPLLPQSIALQIGLARGFQQKKDFQKSIAVCDNILATHPNSLDALLLKSELQKQQNNNAASLATLEKAYSYAPSDADLSYNLAFAYAEEKNPKVLRLTDSLIQKDVTGKHAEPYYIKGVYYNNTGNNAQALNFYNQAIAHDFYFMDAYMDKGSLLYDGKKYSEALQTFQLALKVTPTYADAYYWSGKCQEALKNKAEAKLNYERAFALDKTLTEAKDAAAKL